MVRVSGQIGSGIPAGIDSSELNELPPELRALLKQPDWAFSGALSAGFGYDDNVLLSAAHAHGSAFTRVGLETLLWHLPHGHTDYFAFLNADGTRYFSPAKSETVPGGVLTFDSTVNHEAEGFVGFEWRYRRKRELSALLDAQGYYLDQIFDVSNLLATRIPEELEVAGIKTGPTLQWWFLHSTWIRATGMVARESFHYPLDNSTDGARVIEPKLELGWRPIDRFELTASVEEDRRRYDHHPKFTVNGLVDYNDPGTLAVEDREWEGRARIEWGAGRHWTTTSKATGVRYTDNGSGYFNYRQRKFDQEVEWEVGNWSLDAEGSAGRKTYETQTVGVGLNPVPLVKDEYSTQVRLERKVAGQWRIFAEFRWERTRSNDETASYSVNEGLLGARWSWEK